MLSQVWQGAGSAPLWPAMLSAARWEADREASQLRTLVETHAFALGELQLADLIVLQQLVALAFVGQRGYCGTPITISHVRDPITISHRISNMADEATQQMDVNWIHSPFTDGSTHQVSPLTLERAWGGRRVIELGSSAHVAAAIEARRNLTNRAIDVVLRHLTLCPELSPQPDAGASSSWWRSEWSTWAQSTDNSDGVRRILTHFLRLWDPDAVVGTTRGAVVGTAGGASSRVSSERDDDDDDDRLPCWDAWSYGGQPLEPLSERTRWADVAPLLSFRMTKVRSGT